MKKNEKGLEKKKATPSFIPINEKRFLEILRENKGTANTRIVRKSIGGTSGAKQNNAIRKVAKELKEKRLIGISFTGKGLRPTRIYKLR